jgi:membrane-associated phospholipid phosphatase
VTVDNLVNTDRVGAIDEAIARWIAEHRTDWLTDVCELLQAAGLSAAFMATMALIGVGFIAVHGTWHTVPQILVATITTGIMTRPLKGWIDRPRPSGDLTITTLYEPAMPSSHALLTASVVTAIVLAPWWTSTTWRRVTAALGIFGCVVVAAAMMYLGGHWLSDILVGWVLGAGITAVIMLAWQWRAARTSVTAGRDNRTYAPD